MSSRTYNHTILFVLLFSLLFLPLAVGAQANLPVETVNFLTRVTTVISALIALLSGLALIFFIVNLIRFIFHAGNEEERREGKKAMGWSIIALFVMVSIWGIVVLLRVSILGDGIAGTISSMLPPIINNERFSGDGLPFCIGNVGPEGCPADSPR